jgi:hypothetical protein
MANSLQPQQSRISLIATPTSVRPGNFVLGSTESRAAARALAQSRSVREELSPEIARAAIDPLFWLQSTIRARGTAIGGRPAPPVRIDPFQISLTSHR